MVNPKCKVCHTYISEVELKSSGEPYKTCKRCRATQKNNYKNKMKSDANVVKKEEINKLTDDMYEVKMKIIDEELAKKLVPEYGKKYNNIDDIPDENIVIPDNCFKYVIGAKMTPEMMVSEDEDNNIYPDEIYPECSKAKLPVWKPDSESD
jgi:hypothetical protein